MKLLAEQSEKFPNGRIGLITSSLHMTRAMRLAEAEGLCSMQGVELVPLPSGHHATTRPWKPIDLVPDAETVNGNSYLLHEYLAWFVGR